MPRAKGPEKVAFKVMVTIPTFQWLTHKANGKAVPTYVAEDLERRADVATKNVSPNFKKGGKK
jgi:hypothetical protein